MKLKYFFIKITEFPGKKSSPKSGLLKKYKMLILAKQLLGSANNNQTFSKLIRSSSKSEPQNLMDQKKCAKSKELKKKLGKI